MNKLEIVSMVKIDGVWVRQEEISQEEFQKIIESKFDEAMCGIGFDRIKTA